MRTGATLIHFSTPLSKMGAATAAGAAAARATHTPSSAPVPRSPWHSPVPYLFGGLAAMLGLIAFALLILACSYWKVSAGEDGGERDVEGGAAEKGDGGSDAKAHPVFEEKFLVIMAGDDKPTFLATPVFNKKNSVFEDDDVSKVKLEEDIKEDGNGEEADESLQVSREQIH